MKTYTLYRQILEKAEMVYDAALALAELCGGVDTIRNGLHAIESVNGLDKELAMWETDIKKDPRRAVQILFVDYCIQRDELKALLNQEVLPAQDAVNHLTQAKRASDAALAYPQMFSSEPRTIDLSTLPPEDPRHVCGMFCDGQDGMNSDCAMRKRAVKQALLF